MVKEVLPRMFLHAAILRFHHPVSGELLELRAALPKDLQGYLDKVVRVQKQDYAKEI